MIRPPNRFPDEVLALSDEEKRKLVREAGGRSLDDLDPEFRAKVEEATDEAIRKLGSLPPVEVTDHRTRGHQAKAS